MDRREFLHFSGMAALGLYASRLDGLQMGPSAVREGPAKRVAILGAGIAGLAAGLELTQGGHDVTILEAQLRPGGRVYTLRAPFSDGLHAEAGAGRIPSTHQLTLEYVKRFKLELEVCGKSYSTQESQTILSKSLRRNTDRTDHPLSEILPPAHEID